jgi:hypothetical protein
MPLLSIEQGELGRGWEARVGDKNRQEAGHDRAEALAGAPEPPATIPAREKRAVWELG